MLFGAGDGEMGPPYGIIKCSVTGVDLTSAKVLSSLHKESGFTAEEGWSLKVWERELSLQKKGAKKGTLETKTHRRPYLIHEESLEIITCQVKAWMDTPGICMWHEVQVIPWAARRTGRVLVVWDNCGPHKTEAVKAAFMRARGHKQVELPPKMTDILQAPPPQCRTPLLTTRPDARDPILR